MARKGMSYNALINMAESYGIANNPLFISAANQYMVQQKVIEEIKKSIQEADALAVTKEYVKGRENLYVNPLIRELPKHSDSANKTLAMMLDIIVKFGHEQDHFDALAEFMD